MCGDLSSVGKCVQNINNSSLKDIFNKALFNGMDEFQNFCKSCLVDWYYKQYDVQLNLDDVYIVWSCKSLQNYKCLSSTNVDGDGIYAEYTYNGDKHELYEDVYKKLTNTCYKK